MAMSASSVVGTELFHAVNLHEPPKNQEEFGRLLLQLPFMPKSYKQRSLTTAVKGSWSLYRSTG